jgi:hypothetical protein
VVYHHATPVSRIYLWKESWVKRFTPKHCHSFSVFWSQQMKSFCTFSASTVWRWWLVWRQIISPMLLSKFRFLYYLHIVHKAAFTPCKLARATWTPRMRADVSCKLWKVRHVEIWSEMRLPLFHLPETSARSSPAPDSNEPRCIVETWLNILRFCKLSLINDSASWLALGPFFYLHIETLGCHFMKMWSHFLHTLLFLSENGWNTLFRTQKLNATPQY